MILKSPFNTDQLEQSQFTSRNRNRKRELDIARITKKNMRALQKFAKRI